MKYIYQKRTLHSMFVFLILKLKSYIYLIVTASESLSPLRRDLLVAATCKF